MNSRLQSIIFTNIIANEITYQNIWNTLIKNTQVQNCTFACSTWYIIIESNIRVIYTTIIFSVVKTKKRTTLEFTNIYRLSMFSLLSRKVWFSFSSYYLGIFNNMRWQMFLSNKTNVMVHAVYITISWYIFYNRINIVLQVAYL